MNAELANGEYEFLMKNKSKNLQVAAAMFESWLFDLTEVKVFREIDTI